jgi:hypothetical protein
MAATCISGLPRAGGKYRAADGLGGEVYHENRRA